MRFYLSILLLFAALLSLTACQTTTANRDVLSTTNKSAALLPLALPIQIDYQDEVKLLRINQIITEKKNLTVEERSRLFYERGIIYDRMGLSAHSRYDFSQAISVDPSFAEPYNLLGLYLLLARSYDEAFEAFDSALELSDNMEYSYLHRAIGLYQIKRYALASQDIEKFVAFDENDPYRVLWRYIINSEIDKEKALTRLQNTENLANDNRYIWSLVDVIAGRKRENEFFKSISDGVSTNIELAQRLCEAYFYLAYWHKVSGNLSKAIYYFKLSTATNVHEFIEYKYSLIELASIQLMLQNKGLKELKE